MNEIIWKTLVYQGDIYDKFEISNNGQLRNIKTETIYKQTINKKGYCQVCVSLGSRSKKKIFRIHKAVAETFISNPENKQEVNHKDGDKSNNNVSNLEWVTASENIQHAYQNGLKKPLYGMDNGASKLTQSDIEYIRERFVYGDHKCGARALGRKFNVDKNMILDVVRHISYTNI